MSNVDVLIEGVGKVRVPKGYNWIARDHDGSWWAYRYRPRANPDEGHWDTPTLEPVVRLTDGDTTVPDWLETLRRVGADEVCPGCNGNGQTPEAGVAFDAPVICPDCAGSGRAEDSITANESTPPRPEVSDPHGFKEAWDAVFDALMRIDPSFADKSGETGIDAAVNFIGQIGAVYKQASAPVGVELAALRVQEWFHAEHDLLVPVQEIEAAMRTPCSCPATEHVLAQQPAAVDDATRRDAERYRYLRRPEAWKENHISERGASAIFIGDGRRGEAKDGEALDAAIDRILADQQQGGAS